MKNFSFIKIVLIIAFSFAGIRAAAKPVTFKLSEIKETISYDTYTEVKLNNGEIIRFYDENRGFDYEIGCYMIRANLLSEEYARGRKSYEAYKKEIKGWDRTITVNTTTDNRNYLK